MEENINFEKGKVDLLSELLVIKEESQVMLQGFAKGNQIIQLQNSTTLTCYKNHLTSRVLFSFGIPTYPEFSEGIDQKFTLIFESLPEDCSSFYYQSVPTSGTWRCYEFDRNMEDAYIFEIE